MNLLENFVNKFSNDQKSFSFNNKLNESNNSTIDTLTKTINTKKSYLSNNLAANPTENMSQAIYLDNSSIIDNNDSIFNNNQIPANISGQPVHLASFNCDSNSPKNCSQDGNSNSKKTMRNMFSYSQIEILENIFEQTHYPDSTMREKLSAHLGINASRIQVWFQNRRAKFRKFDLKNKKMGNTSISCNSSIASDKCVQQKADEIMNFNINTNNYFESKD